MKSYTILINSQQGVGTAASDKVYKFDWSIIPKGEYEMSFSFISEPLKTLEGAAEGTNQAMALEFIAPLSRNSYRVDANGFANSTNVIGLLEVESVEGYGTCPRSFRCGTGSPRTTTPPLIYMAHRRATSSVSVY